MKVTVYLSGEIHTDWRNEIKDGAQKYGLDIEFVSAVTEMRFLSWANLCR